MSTWLAPQKAAKYLKERNPETMIGEKTIRTLIKNGFPCVSIESRTLINVDTFDQDLIEFSKKKTVAETHCEITPVNGIRRIAG